MRQTLDLPIATVELEYQKGPKIMQQYIIVMGVSGCGKSSVGRALASQMGAVFKDGDDLHPAANIEKMRNEIALTDEDRRPWLDAIHEFAKRQLETGTTVIVACSALKQSYRQRLTKAGETPATFIYLQGDTELISTRQAQRQGHFMPASLIESQFATLESPAAEANVISINISATVAEIVSQACEHLYRN